MTGQAIARDETLGTQLATQAEQNAVRNFLAAIDNATASRDLDQFLALMSDDVVVLAPDIPSLVGKAAVGEFYRNLFTAFVPDPQGTHQTEAIDVVGDIVIDRGHFSGNLTPVGGGEPIRARSKYLFILRKKSDGVLILWRAVFNSDAPRPTGQ